jgi:hypothetical protein
VWIRIITTPLHLPSGWDACWFTAAQACADAACFVSTIPVLLLLLLLGLRRQTRTAVISSSCFLLGFQHQGSNRW